MKYFFGFIDKWLSILFILLVLFILFLVNKCSESEEIVIDEIPIVSGEIDNSNSNISGIRVLKGTTYQDPESGIILTIGDVYESYIECAYVLPDGTNKSEFLDNGKGFGFLSNNQKSYDVILISTKEDNYAVFSIKEGNKFTQNNSKQEEETYSIDSESSSLKKGDTLDEGELNIFIENVDLENQVVTAKCVLGDESNNLQLEVGKIHKFKHEGKYYKFKVTKIEDEFGENVCRIHYWTPFN
jgi:hypothetical protein